MFWKKENPQGTAEQAIREMTISHGNAAGCTRRATSMVPVAVAGVHEIAHTSTIKFHQLLISLEGNQRTGCLRVISPKRKSRSAIMIYRGRVVGCLYGSRKIEGHYLMQDAHRHALADLAAPGNILDAYELPDPLVLAAAALFSGGIVRLDGQQGSRSMMDQGLRALADMQLPGCAVVSNAGEEMICMVYMHEGKIIGLYSAKDGWVKPSYDAALSYTENGQAAKVMAAYLPVSEEHLDSIGFSLTGLADQMYRQEWAQQQLQAIDSFTTLPAEAKQLQDLKVPLPSVKKQPKPTWTKQTISTVPSHNTFAICP